MRMDDSNSMSIIEEAYKKAIDEGEGGGAIGASTGGGIAGGETGGEPAVPFHDCPGIDTEKVLGKFDPKKGCMGKGDFHLPKKIMPLLRRWPVVNYKRKKSKKRNKEYLNEQDNASNNCIFVYNIPQDKLEWILDNSQIENKRHDRSQLTKYLNGDSDIEIVALFDKFPDKCLAVAVIAFDRAQIEDCYICEIQSLQKGFGKKLLLDLLKHQKNLWLMANVNADDNLLKFYRDKDFKFKEYVVQDSVYDCPAHFFYTGSCNKTKLIDHIDKSFKKNN